jgi:hypothetical protein
MLLSKEARGGQTVPPEKQKWRTSITSFGSLSSAPQTPIAKLFFMLILPSGIQNVGRRRWRDMGCCVTFRDVGLQDAPNTTTVFFCRINNTYFLASLHILSHSYPSASSTHRRPSWAWTLKRIAAVDGVPSSTVTRYSSNHGSVAIDRRPRQDAKALAHRGIDIINTDPDLHIYSALSTAPSW